jgi:hypothetical protein
MPLRTVKEASGTKVKVDHGSVASR